MADFGKSGEDYKPNLFSGIIGKIAYQVVEGMDTVSKFDTFNKESVETGKDIEITLYEDATGVEYNKEGQMVIPDPTNHTLYFTEYDERTYLTKINKWDIDKASKDRSYAEKSAGVIIETLYGGDKARVKEQNYAQFIAAAASAGAPNAAGSVKIVSTGSVPEVTDETSARAVLSAIKLTASGMREEPEAFNPYALPTRPRRIVMLIPYQTRVKLELYLLTTIRNLNYSDYGVDEVIDIPASKIEGSIFIVDERYVQNRVRKMVYEEYPIQFSGGNVKAGLSTSRMYALCPLFPAAVIKQEAASSMSANKALDNISKTIEANKAAAQAAGMAEKIEQINNGQEPKKKRKIK